MFIAPNYGALIFSPILIFAIIGYLLLPKKNLNPLQELLILFFPCILADFLIYSAFGAWRGSIYSYGPRYITGILPILILYLVAFFNYHFPNRECSSKKVGVTIVIVLFLFISVFIQFIGVYYYAYLPVKGMNEQRAWDWNDSVIIGSFDAGFGKNITVTMYSFNPFPPIISYQFIQRSDTSPTQYLIQSMNASRNY